MADKNRGLLDYPWHNPLFYAAKAAEQYQKNSVGDLLSNTNTAINAAPEMALSFATGLLSLPIAGYNGLMVGFADPDKHHVPMGYRDENGVWQESLMAGVIDPATGEPYGEPMLAADAVERRMNKGTFVPRSQFGQEGMQGLGEAVMPIMNAARPVTDFLIQKGGEAGLPPALIGGLGAGILAGIESFPGSGQGVRAGRAAARAADVPASRVYDGNLLEVAARHDDTLLSKAEIGLDVGADVLEPPPSVPGGFLGPGRDPYSGPGRSQAGAIGPNTAAAEAGVISNAQADFKRRSGGFNHGVEVRNNPETGRLEFVDDLMNDQVREFGINQGYDPDAYLHSTALFSNKIENMQAERLAGNFGPRGRMRGSIENTGGGKEVLKTQSQRAGLVQGVESAQIGSKTFVPAKADKGNQVVMMTREELDDLLTGEFIGPGPDYQNQIGNRIQGFQDYLTNNDRIEVGDLYINLDGPEPYASFGDGRHRTRFLMDSGLREIPVSMNKENIAKLNQVRQSRADDAAKAEAVDAGLIQVMPEREIKAGEFGAMRPGVRSRESFNQKLSEARQGMDIKGRAQVDPELPADFDGTTYLTPDGMAGFAIDKDGYISHLFRNEGAEFKGAMGAALTKARAAGAKNLHAIDDYLVESYMRRGTVESERFNWDPNQSTLDMDLAFGDTQPDYVGMDIGGVIPTQKHSLILGPRVQQELARFHAARGEPKAVTDAFKGGKVNRLNRIVDQGLAQGGDKWYWMAGMLDKFIVELGPEMGLKRFDDFMDLNAAVSPRSAVSTQIKRASVLYQRLVTGKSLDLKQPKGTSANPKGLGPAFPPGYGHLAADIHASNVRELQPQGGILTGTWDPIEKPKITSYTQDMKGNYIPLTSDSHNRLIVMGQEGSPTAAQYPYLESRQGILAARKDLDPAEWQSALWVGGGDITGVRDVRNLPDAMNQRIAKTAEVLGIPEEEALIRFMHGDTRLYSVMGAMFLGPAAYEKLKAGEAPASET